MHDASNQLWRWATYTSGIREGVGQPIRPLLVNKGKCTIDKLRVRTLRTFVVVQCYPAATRVVHP